MILVTEQFRSTQVCIIGRLPIAFDRKNYKLHYIFWLPRQKSDSAFHFTFLTIVFASTVFANPTQFTLQQDLELDQPIAGSAFYKMVRFMEDGSVTAKVSEPQCLLYAVSPVKETIAKGTVILIKSTNIDNPQDTSQALFHKDRSVTAQGEVSGGREFRANCSDSAISKMLLKDFSVDVINQYVGQYLLLE